MEEELDLLALPAGFRFHPTDQEVITYYLSNKIADNNFASIAMPEADFNKCEPWDLPKMAKMGEREWYFFCRRDKKYPTGTRTNRATQRGYWKATGKDKLIVGPNRNAIAAIGTKKTLVFYTGRAPRGQKTNWVMHEYRLLHPAKDDWVVCKVIHKEAAPTKTVRVQLHPNAVFCFEGSPFSDACLFRQQIPKGVDFNYLPSFASGGRHHDGSIAMEGSGVVSHDDAGPTADASVDVSSVSIASVQMDGGDWREGDDLVELGQLADFDWLWNY